MTYEDNEDTQTGVGLEDSFYLSLCRSLVPFFLCAMMSPSRRFNRNCRFLPLLHSFGPTLCTRAHFAGLYHLRKKGAVFIIFVFFLAQGFFIVFHPDRMEVSADRRHRYSRASASQRLSVTDSGISAPVVRGTSCRKALRDFPQGEAFICTFSTESRCVKEPHGCRFVTRLCMF